MSLTSISDEVGIIRKHFLGSLDFLQTFTLTLDCLSWMSARELGFLDYL